MREQCAPDRRTRQYLNLADQAFAPAFSDGLKKDGDDDDDQKRCAKKPGYDCGHDGSFRNVRRINAGSLDLQSQRQRQRHMHHRQPD